MTVFHNDMIANIVKQHAMKLNQSYSYPRFARLKEYDPETNLVKVAYFNPENEEWELLSNWLAYMAPVNGIGDDSESEGGDPGELWGHQFGPNINEQVLVIPIDGDHNNGIVIGSIYTEKRPPPTAEGELTESGEFLWRHKSGSFLKFSNSGDVLLTTKEKVKIHVGTDGNILIEGDLHQKVVGNVYQEVDGDVRQVVKGQSTSTVHGDSTLISRGSVDVEAAQSLKVVAQTGMTFECLGDFTVLSEANILLLAGGEVIFDGGVTVPPAIAKLGDDDLPEPDVHPGGHVAANPAAIEPAPGTVTQVNPGDATIEL